MNQKGLIAIFGILIFMVMTGTSLAQRGVPVTEKPRPDYDALGINAGGFNIKPELKLGLEYNDNIYATKSSKESDWITTIAPKVDVNSNWSRHALNLSTGLKGGIYSSESDENYIDGHIFLDGRLDVLRESFFMAQTGLQRLHEDRGNPDAGATWDEPAVYYRSFGDLSYFHGVGKTSVSVGTGITNYDFKKVDQVGGGSENLNYRDRNIYNVNGRVAYELTPDVQPFITSRYEWRRYDKNDPNHNAKRNSKGYRIGLGTGFDLGGVTSGEIYAGYMHQDYDNFKNVSGMWYSLSLLWNVTELTSVQANVQSSVKETTSQNASGIQGSDLGIRVDHELLKNLLVGAFFDYTHDSYKGISRTDKYYTMGPRVTYLWNRNLSADFTYSYKNRDSNRAEDYKENKFAFGITGKF